MGAIERPRPSRWPVAVVALLAVVGALSVVRWVLGTVTTVLGLAVVVGLVVLVVKFLKGPPGSR